MAEKERTVIHLEIFKEDGNIHEYYGSVASLFEHHNKEELGIVYSSFRNYSLSPSNPYINQKCIIRKGILVSKEGKRGETVKELMRALKSN